MRIFWAAFVILQVFGGGVNEKNKEGAALYDEGKLDEALVAFTQAQEQSPDAPEIHYNIGNVHFQEQEMDKALEEYRTALNGSSEVQARSHYNSGNAHYRAQSYPEAIDAYKQALKVDGQDLEARQNLELALQKQQEQQQQQDGEENSEEGDPEEQDRQGQQDPSQGEQDQQQDPSQAQPGDQQTASQSEEGEEAQPQGMSREEAERILAALAEMERAEQRKQQENRRTRTPGSGKDW